LRTANIDAWRRFLYERKLDAKLVATWSGQARPNIRLVPWTTLDGDNTTPRTSKLGGAPDLPIDFHWPARPPYRYSREGRDFLPEAAWKPQPLTFLGQINLSDIAKAGCDLPLMWAGLLLFFYDVETQPLGCDPLDAPGAQVLFVGADTATQRQVNPQFGSRRVQPLRFVPEDGLPGWEWVRDNVRDQTGYSHEAFYADLEKLSDEDWEVIAHGAHAFGGWPSEIQGPMEIDCEMMTTGGHAGSTDGNIDLSMPDRRRRARSGACSCNSALTTIWAGYGVTRA
jgi:hypothetical protein